MSDADRALLTALTGVSRETMQRLNIYADLLRRWNPAINLVAKATLGAVWPRHILDSAQLWRIAPERADTWADLGSGAGLPGLVIAAIAAEKRPQLRMTLVDSDTRKCAFMRTAAQAMGLSVDIRTQRLEKPPSERFAVISARALAPAPALFAMVSLWLDPEGVALLPKGAGVEQELTDASRDWHSHIVRTQSITDAAGVILSVTELRRASA